MLKCPRNGNSTSILSVLGGLYLLPISALLVAAGCSSSDRSQEGIAEQFVDSPMESPRLHTYSWEDASCFYASAGDPGRPAVIFIHGSPGSWENYLTFFNSPSLREKAHLIAVDRPGFGRSSATGPTPSLENQAQALSAVLPPPDGPSAILVAHSLGGAVAVRMALDFPGRIGGLVLVAPSISPPLEKLRWYNRLAAFPALKWALPQAIRYSNEEILPLKTELEAMEPRLPEIDFPVLVIHGMRDRLVPPGNADYVRESFTSASVEVQMLPELNHFIPWTRPALIEEAVLRLLARQPRSDATPSLQP